MKTGAWYLEPLNSQIKSFGKQAVVHVQVKDGVRTAKLYSYCQLVAETTMELDAVPEHKHAIMFTTHRGPVMKHIKEFLLQEGKRADNTKQIVRDYCLLKY